MVAVLDKIGLADNCAIVMVYGRIFSTVIGKNRA